MKMHTLWNSSERHNVVYFLQWISYSQFQCGYRETRLPRRVILQPRSQNPTRIWRSHSQFSTIGGPYQSLASRELRVQGMRWAPTWLFLLASVVRRIVYSMICLPRWHSRWWKPRNRSIACPFPVKSSPDNRIELFMRREEMLYLWVQNPYGSYLGCEAISRPLFDVLSAV